MLDEYTSTGQKFLRHKFQFEQYKHGLPRSIISTHISPEGRCNLNCTYCCQGNRNRAGRIALDKIIRYLYRCQTLGCKAVIITGGGEPTLYPPFMRLMESIKLSFPTMQYAMITNGTTIQAKRLQRFGYTWIRISVNGSAFWHRKFMEIQQPFSSDCTVGLSFVYTGINKTIRPTDLLKYADRVNAKYIRLIPDMRLIEPDLQKAYDNLEEWLGEYSSDQRFMIQKKKHHTPIPRICHQSYFRPFLSELNGGTVFPCDSISLNNNSGQFDPKYALCGVDDFVNYMQRKIQQPFSAHKDCSGCVFSHNVNMLDSLLRTDNPEWITEPIIHENFV